MIIHRIRVLVRAIYLLSFKNIVRSCSEYFNRGGDKSSAALRDSPSRGPQTQDDSGKLSIVGHASPAVAHPKGYPCQYKRRRHSGRRIPRSACRLNSSDLVPLQAPYPRRETVEAYIFQTISNPSPISLSTCVHTFSLSYHEPHRCCF